MTPTTAFRVALTWPLAFTGAVAQTSPPAGDLDSAGEICRELAAFVEGRGGTIKAAQTTISLDQVRGYLRDGNRFACRSAISVMRTSGVALPQTLLNAIGRDSEQPAAGPLR
jgi:hypothetical protein